MVKQKDEPLPGMLSTDICPFWASTSFLHMASPSPEPPKSLVISDRSCVKLSNIISLFSLEIPIPVSLTWNWRKHWSSVSFSSSTPRMISPSFVNFTALLMRLDRIWLSLTLSPLTISGIPTMGSSLRVFSFSLALALKTLRVSSSICPGFISSSSRTSFSDSSLLKSRISFIRESKVSPEYFRALRYSSWSGLGSISSKSCDIPITAFRGVLISWLMVDRNCCFAIAASSAIIGKIEEEGSGTISVL